MRDARGAARATPAGRRSEALRELEAVERAARADLLLPVAFDATLARGETEVGLGKRAEGRRTLETLAAQARAKGALRVAIAADALLAAVR